MPFACIWLSKICNDSVFRMGKEGMGKGKLIFVSIILFTLKYIVVVVPLIVGLAVNNGTHRHYFDSIFLVVATLIYPLTTLVVQGYFVRISKKEHK
jgi:ABC-type glycerol-3-phosphate transport system permease component